MQMRMTVLEVDDKLERSARFSAEVGPVGVVPDGVDSDLGVHGLESHGDQDR